MHTDAHLVSPHSQKNLTAVNINLHLAKRCLLHLLWSRSKTVHNELHYEHILAPNGAGGSEIHPK
jgi:hypothetical protein